MQKKNKNLTLASYLFTDVFTNHLDKIVKYLSYQDLNKLKLVNRICYYTIITIDIWSHVKLQINQIKMEYLENDFQFQNQINEAEPTNKVLRNIRIHSLNKKNSEQESSKLNLKKKKIIQHRFPSTYKNTVPPENFQEPKFMKTEIGFKKLNKNKNLQNYDYLLELPENYEVSNFQIKLNDNMSKNIDKARVIGEILSRIIEFQKKMLEDNDQNKTSQKYTIFWKQKDNLYTQYLKKLKDDRYDTILKNMEQWFIIDESLNKKYKQYSQNHKIIVQNSPKLKIIIEYYQEIQKKLIEIKNEMPIKGLETLEEILQKFLNTLMQSKPVINIKSINFIQQIQILLNKYIRQIQINIKMLCINPQESQINISIIFSVVEKLIKILENLQNKFKQNLLLNKFKNYKIISNNLLKLVKYFVKIKSQLKIKQKKGGDDGVIQINKFLKFYQNYEIEFEIYDQKNVQKIQKEVVKFKNKIEQLKANMKQK